MPHSIVLMAAWFGPWPAWIDFFLLSCGANTDIDWLIISDQPPPESTPNNVKVIATSFSDYKQFLSSKINVNLHENSGAYKLCDLKPALGHLHEDQIRDYDFFGFTDLDVVYGDIRYIYDADVLGGYDALSTHAEHVSGHFFLMRNTKALRTAFMSIPGWRDMCQQQRYDGFDEQGFYSYFKNGPSPRPRLLSLGRRRPYLFRETYSTPMPAADIRWYWKGGKLTNEFYPHRFFLYLHFMAWQSNKWYPYASNIAPGTPAPWQDRADIVQIDWRSAQEKGFMIGPAGIQAIQERPYP